MRHPSSLSRRLAGALPLAALGLCLAAPTLRAQSCPSQTVTITCPSSGANMGGTVPVVVIMSAPAPPGWNQGTVTCTMEDFSNPPKVVDQGPCYVVNSTTYAYNCNTTAMNNGTYQMVVTTSLYNPVTQQTCPEQSTTTPTVICQNPAYARLACAQTLQRADVRDSVCTGSASSPLTGNQTFTVPITAWDYKGTTIPFALTYNSIGVTDPAQPANPNFSGLSDRNSKWTHPFAQWLDFYYTEDTKALYAVWHHGNQTLSFAQGSGTSWTSPDSYHTLNGDGVTATQSVTCVVNGMNMPETVMAPDSSFTLTDEDNTTYQFGGSGNVYWQINGCMALPHYLLTSITDRWGRKLTITWGTPPGTTEPRVMTVKDDTGAGITLNYTGDLISSVLDPQNRTHTLVYTPVLAEAGGSPMKLTSVQVKGPGDSTRVTDNWSFSYQDPNDPQNLAYGGTYTGDLVIHKTEPNGQVTNYSYEPVAIVGGNHLRLRADDWNGRVSKITWTDTDSSAREIDRSALNSSSQDTLTFFSNNGAGGVPVQYAYSSGDDLASVTDVSTGRRWQYGYDGYHNLTSVKTPLETGANPLVQYGYTYANGSQISQVIEQVLQSDGSLGNPVTTLFNTILNIPTQITASGSGHPDQVTKFHYDNDAPITRTSPGNPTGLVEAYGQPEHQTTAFTYNGTAGAWGLPDTVTNAVGGVSGFMYDTSGSHPSGRLLNASSPDNGYLGVNDPDRGVSTTVLAYNADGLPSLVQDPMGHQVTVGYNAAGAGSANLVITLTYPPYNNQRLITVDPRGRVIMDQDENGVVTVWAYNAEDQVVSVTRASGTSDAATTTFHYNAQDDLDYFDPPGGSAGRVNFEYGRYNLVNNQPVYDGTYEGQVTRIRYPDNSSEYFGHNNAAELAWRVKGDGRVITIGRDTLHRINSIAYPASAVDNGFTVTAHYDEFGRTDSTVDPRGTTSLTYDSLNRLTKVVPPGLQKEVDYGYSGTNNPMADLHYWTTTATLVGVGSGPYSYVEDNKGRLSQLVSPFNQTSALHYDLDGKNLEVDLPNGTKELRSYYEPQDWLQSITLKAAGGATEDQLTYYPTDAGGSYDPTGRIHREIDLGGRVHAFSYNKRYELTGESDPYVGNVAFGYDLNGNRTSRTDGTGTDYYGVDANNKLLWVNHGTNAAPTSGQANPYMLFGYDGNGNTTHRERRFPDGTLNKFDLYWDGADNLRTLYQSGVQNWIAAYNGDGLRVRLFDTAGGSFPTEHDFTWGLGGVLYDTFNSTTYTPGVSQNVNGTDSFFHDDWLGSTRYLSDSTGNNFPSALRYDAFGNRTATGGPIYDPTPFQFAGACCSYYLSV